MGNKTDCADPDSIMYSCGIVFPSERYFSAFWKTVDKQLENCAETAKTAKQGEHHTKKCVCNPFLFQTWNNSNDVFSLPRVLLLTSLKNTICVTILVHVKVAIIYDIVVVDLALKIRRNSSGFMKSGGQGMYVE